MPVHWLIDSRARLVVGGARARFDTGDGAALPWRSAARDVTVSGLVLNFVRDHAANVAARMEQIAAADSTFLSEYTAKLVPGYFQLRLG